MEIRERIIEFLRSENISSANFAQEIGVQPSGISHIISGRNKPSLDFIVKMLNRYPSLSTDWLLFGKGKMLKNNIPGDLFAEVHPGDTSPVESDMFDLKETSDRNRKETGSVTEKELNSSALSTAGSSEKASRIVIFYDDSTFSEFIPR